MQTYDQSFLAIILRFKFLISIYYPFTPNSCVFESNKSFNQNKSHCMSFKEAR